MTPLSPDPDDPDEAAQLAGVTEVIRIAAEQSAARDTVVLPAVAGR